MPIKNTLKKNSLLSIKELSEKSYKFYSENFKNLILIMILAFVPIAILDILLNKITMSAITATGTNAIMMILLSLAILLIFAIMIILTIANQIALIYFIDKKSSLKESYAATKKYFFSYLFINIILLIIAKGVSLLLSTFSNTTSEFLIKTISSKSLVIILLFLIFLAIIFLILYIIIKLLFSFIILIAEDVKGIQALKRSRAIIGVYWLEVSIRFVTFLLAFAIINRIFAYLANMIPSFPLSYYIAYLISSLPFIFLLPFALIYIYTLYKNLNELS